MSEKDCSRSGNDRCEVLKAVRDEILETLRIYQVTLDEWDSMRIDIKAAAHF